MIRKRRVALAVSAVLTCAATSGGTAGPSATAGDEEAVWKLEQSIYSGGSGRSNLANYVQALDPDYAGWPPQAAAPLGHAHIAEAAAKASGRDAVELTMTKELVRVHRDGNVALAYYTTHRAARAGASADAAFETLHVWVKGSDGEWKLFGAMVRTVPPARAASRTVAPRAEAR